MNAGVTGLFEPLLTISLPERSVTQQLAVLECEPSIQAESKRETIWRGILSVKCEFRFRNKGLEDGLLEYYNWNLKRVLDYKLKVK